MDPILTTLLAAASLVAKGIASEAIKDAYHDLKDLIKSRVGGKAEADLVLDKLDEKPDVWEGPARDLLAESEIEKDSEIVRAAKQLAELIGSAQIAVGDRAVQFGTIMNLGGTTNIAFGDIGSKPYEPQAPVESNQDKGAVLLELAVLRGEGFRLRNRGHSLTNEQAYLNWRAEVVQWSATLIEKMSSLDRIDAELSLVLGNMPIREYPNTEFVNDSHLLFLRALDERLVRLEGIIAKHHTLLIQGLGRPDAG